jgi:protein-tyrosine phosphatase
MGMIDIHCHILFGVDDGSDSLAESVEMAKIAYSGGTEIIVATPHSNVTGSYQNMWNETFEERVNELNQALEQSGCPVVVYPGQEIFCADGYDRYLQQGYLIPLNGSRYPLVEFDFDENSFSVYEKLRKLRSLGYVPVVAHPERYSFVHEDVTAMYQMKNLGCLLQVNKGSLHGSFGGQAYAAALRILDNGCADMVASDAHSPYRRTPYLDETYEFIAETYSFDYANWLLKENPYRVIQDKEITSF